MISGSKGLNPHKLAHRWGPLTPTSYNADTKNIKAIIPSKITFLPIAHLTPKEVSYGFKI